ncbi:MAG TPA: hypothetical protein GXX29_09435 [Firmicutes bacterium]|nr:hypothetical protein [Bacillota bacterium]
MSTPVKKRRFLRFTLLVAVVFFFTATASAYLTYFYINGTTFPIKRSNPRYEIGTFVVDLIPDNVWNHRLLKAQVMVEADHTYTVRVLRRREAEVRDAVNKILRNQTPTAVAGRTGMEKLAEEVKKAINEEVLGQAGVVQVYFPELVMQ